MASPIAHSLTGASIYFLSRRYPGERHTEIWWLIFAANAADFDLLPGLLLGDESMFHRTFSHSILFAVAFSIAVYLISSRAGHREPQRFAVLMFLAYLSQLLIDWFSYDQSTPQGIMVLWPLTREYYMSEPTVLLNISRTDAFSWPTIVHNLRAVALELVIFGPVTAYLWYRNGRHTKRQC